MSYGSVFVCREKGVKCGSPVIKGHVLHLFLLQRKAPGVLGGGLLCLALTSLSRRLLHRRNDMSGGEGNAALDRCEGRRMFKLLKMIRRTNTAEAKHRRPPPKTHPME